MSREFKCKFIIERKNNKKGWDNQTGFWEVYNRNGKLSYKEIY